MDFEERKSSKELKKVLTRKKIKYIDEYGGIQEKIDNNEKEN